MIVANAPGFAAAPFRALLLAADQLIAADGGGNALHDAGLHPHLLIGDFDSLAPEALAAFVAAGSHVRHYPPAKDETDLELALLAAVELGADQIDLLGTMGGRWDQALANVNLLALPELLGRRVRMLDEQQEAYLARGTTPISGGPGETVSLLPLGGPACGVTTRGLAYPLDEAELPFERSRGVSNLIVAPPAEVRVREGLLLVVHTLRHVSTSATPA